MLGKSTAIKSGCVIAWKAIMTVEAPGRSQRKQAQMRNNKSSLPGLIGTMSHNSYIKVYNKSNS